MDFSSQSVYCNRSTLKRNTEHEAQKSLFRLHTKKADAFVGICKQPGFMNFLHSRDTGQSYFQPTTFQRQYKQDSQCFIGLDHSTSTALYERMKTWHGPTWGKRTFSSIRVGGGGSWSYCTQTEAKIGRAEVNEVISSKVPTRVRALPMGTRPESSAEDIPLLRMHISSQDFWSRPHPPVSVRTWRQVCPRPSRRL